MRTQARMAKALADKSQRDLQAQHEQAERRMLAETMDNDIKRWAAGKEGNLRALLSSLQQGTAQTLLLLAQSKKEEGDFGTLKLLKETDSRGGFQFNVDKRNTVQRHAKLSYTGFHRSFSTLPIFSQYIYDLT
ncbi:Auxilin-related protein [Abeliophyllum distichum]|uniref:Auxilin-related protein n=1 Tax=Abeliophyllum distichum TaxID=126358 RepID=A0ABD1SEK0_9LAMI